MDQAALLDSEIPFAQNQIGISRGQVIRLDVDGILDIDLVQCDVMSYMCVFVDHAPTTASFRDDTLINNVFCLNVSTSKICSLGM